tara:strand:- start:1365 stop:2081 length:717 start_codon:yes stop_codon:yes gene_type:complete
MDRKFIINLCVLVGIICVAGIIWTGMGPVAPTRPSPEELEEARALDRVVINEISGEEEIEGWKPEGVSMGSKVMVGIGLLFAVAGYSAIVFVAFVLPSAVNRFTHMFYGAAEELEEDPMHDARAFFAQGDFVGAIEAYRAVAAEQPENRFPWVEIAKIQHDNLEDPDAAIATLRDALESHEWKVNDAAFFMFRLAELYEEDKAELTQSIGILHQVVSLFPETRHSANATHRLRELGAI